MSVDLASQQPTPSLLTEVVHAVVSALATAVAAALLTQGNPIVIVPVILLLSGAGVIVYKRLRSKRPIRRGSWRLVVLSGALGLAIGLLAPPVVALLKSSALPPPQPPPASAAIQVTSPKRALECSNTDKDPFCLFEVKGKVTGMNPADLRSHMVRIFVYPIEPPGEGWYMQRPAMVSRNGQWVQTPSYLGIKQAPARTGHTLRLQAAIVGRDATYNGMSLSDLRPGEALTTVEEIQGIVALSDFVELTVKR